MNRTRLNIVLGIIRNILSNLIRDIKILDHHQSDDREYLKIRIKLSKGFVEIREYIIGNTIRSYAYYFEFHGKRIWWNNKPHHKHISTYPHHRHEDGEVLPLEKPSLEEFLKHIREILKQEIQEFTS
mgnify:CR=1 FL=1